MPNMSVSVVTPAYLKSNSLLPFLLKLTDLLENSNYAYEIIVVIDGDHDQSSKILEEFCSTRSTVKYLVHSKNLGKGAAVRTGVSAIGDADYIAYLDADLDINSDALLSYLSHLEDNQHTDILYASKTHQKSIVNYPLPRKIVSFLLQLLVRMLLRVQVQDTQTGLKVGKSKAMKDSILNTGTNGFAFDLEFFVNAKTAGYIIAPMPVEIDFQFTSTVNIFHVFSVFVDLLKIAFWSRTNRNLRKI